MRKRLISLFLFLAGVGSGIGWFLVFTTKVPLVSILALYCASIVVMTAALYEDGPV